MDTLNYKKDHEKELSNGAAGPVIAHMRSDVIDGETLDTRITVSGQWWIAGGHIKEFTEKLSHLIDMYRI